MARVLVIGAGIHGVTTAIAFAKKGYDVSVVEKNETILCGTSRATHNRAHLGYHYPRSLETAIECIEGLQYFKTKYPGALYYPDESYYFIEKYQSKTQTEEYIKFCQEIGIPFKMVWPDKSIIDPKNIDSSFLVREPNFNLFALKQALLAESESLGIKYYFNSQVVSGVKGNSGIFDVETNREIVFQADVVINATYAYINNILKSFNVNEKELTKYRLQTTEVVVAEIETPLPALTVMDGPFITIQPYVGCKNTVLIYDVVHSVLSETEGYTFGETPSLVSNYDKMIKHGLKYYPFMRSLKFLKSLRGTRPIPVAEPNSGRITKIVDYPSITGLYSIKEGKFISAPLMADALVEKVTGESC